MIHARTIEVNTFDTAMSSLRSSRIKTNDYAGNDILNFLLVAGVGFDCFNKLAQRDDFVLTNQNVFGQNPLHALNPQDLEGYFMQLLEWTTLRGVPQLVLLPSEISLGLLLCILFSNTLYLLGHNIPKL
jgi:hypothetical protein